jgi:hypothetical protein
VMACPPMRSMDYLREIVRHRNRGSHA